jgi:hypothetical protein
MDYAGQLEFYNRVAMEHPLQRGFNLNAFRRFFNLIADLLPRFAVIEMGGWKGELAQEILPFYPITTWTNYEISALAVAQSVCKLSNYKPIVADDFIWAIDLPEAAVFVSSHTIEHLRKRELAQLFERLPESVHFVGLQAPLSEGVTDWTGYYGSHILETGWQGVSQMLTAGGFNIMFEQGEFRAWQR